MYFVTIGMYPTQAEGADVLYVGESRPEAALYDNAAVWYGQNRTWSREYSRYVTCGHCGHSVWIPLRCHIHLSKVDAGSFCNCQPDRVAERNTL